MPKNNENLNLLFNMLLFKFNKNFIYYLIKNFIYEICYIIQSNPQLVMLCIFLNIFFILTAKKYAPDYI